MKLSAVFPKKYFELFYACFTSFLHAHVYVDDADFIAMEGLNEQLFYPLLLLCSVKFSLFSSFYYYYYF